jgi:hypothetical protein
VILLFISAVTTKRYIGLNKLRIKKKKMDRIEIHWMTLIVSTVLLVLLLARLIKEHIQEKRWENRNRK